MVNDTLEEAIPTAMRLTGKGTMAPDDMWSGVIADFSRVQRAVEELQNMVDKLLHQGTAKMQLLAVREQLLAARTELKESHNLACFDFRAVDVHNGTI
jgi:hypothetical protein